MSAELLRRAATRMREHAQAATPGPWRALCDGYADTSLGRSEDDRRDLVSVRQGAGGEGDVVSTWGSPTASDQRARDCTHIASWGPAVALAVADWLDNHAEAAESLRIDPDPRALAVARAYLGGDA